MREVKLSPYRLDVVAFVDDEDYELVSKHKWKYSLGYAVRSSYDYKAKKYKCIYMHRVIAKTPDGFITDHIDRNKLNNTKANLRIADKSLNSINRDKRPDNTTGFVGVYKYYPKEWRDKGWQPMWSARVCRSGKTTYLGYYKSPDEANAARIAFLTPLLSEINPPTQT